MLHVFTNNGAERMRIDSSGKVGIGTTSPSSKFHVSDTYHFTVAGGNSTTGMQIGNYVSSTDTYGVLTYRASTHRFDISGNNKMIIDSSGNIGMGITPQCTTGNILNLDDAYFIGFGNGGSGRPDFQIGTTVGNTLDFRCGFGSDDADLSIATNGVFTGDFNDTSDERLKDNIQDIADNQINVLKQLRPVTFDWKDSTRPNNQTGFVAQELKAVIPNLVDGEEYDETEVNREGSKS